MLNNTLQTNQVNASYLTDVNAMLEHIATTAYQALLVEVNLHPKPGLVTPFSNGSHHDMDIQTFQKSAKALRPFMLEFAKTGYKHTGSAATLLLPLRAIGIQAELAMFTATDGINTHKGAIFILGLLCAICGWSYKNGFELSEMHIAKTSKLACNGLTQELKQAQQKPEALQTHGEKVYGQYGISGLRGEAEEGFPTLIQGLKSYKKALCQPLSTSAALHTTLIELMAHNDDSCVLNRGGMEGLTLVKSQAAALLTTSFSSCDYLSQLNTFDQLLIQRNLSPGGSADFISAIWMLETLQKIL